MTGNRRMVVCSSDHTRTADPTQPTSSSASTEPTSLVAAMLRGRPDPETFPCAAGLEGLSHCGVSGSAGRLSGMQIWPGRPYPLGATFDGTGTNFALFSESAERVELCLLDA